MGQILLEHRRTRHSMKIEVQTKSNVLVQDLTLYSKPEAWPALR